MSSKAGSVPLFLSPEPWSITFVPHLDSSRRFKETVCISQVSNLWATWGICAIDFQRSFSPGIVSTIDIHTLNIWTKLDCKTFSACCVCSGILFKINMANQRKFKEGVQKNLVMWKNMLDKDRLNVAFV